MIYPVSIKILMSTFVWGDHYNSLWPAKLRTMLPPIPRHHSFWINQNTCRPSVLHLDSSITLDIRHMMGEKSFITGFSPR